MNNRLFSLMLRALVSVALPISASAATPPATAPAFAPAAVKVTLQVVTEDGKKSIQATVLSNGKPLENANVAFLVKRTFGDLALGQDKTLDDGTAAVAFPADLPGDGQGKLLVRARVTAPSSAAGAQVSATLAGARPFTPDAQGFPRALWAPRAPYLLIVTVFGILAAVWCCYGYVLFQISTLRRR